MDMMNGKLQIERLIPDSNACEAAAFEPEIFEVSPCESKNLLDVVLLEMFVWRSEINGLNLGLIVGEG